MYIISFVTVVLYSHVDYMNMYLLLAWQRFSGTTAEIDFYKAVLDPPVYASYIRIATTHHHGGGPCMRMELYGWYSDADVMPDTRESIDVKIRSSIF